MIGTRAVGSWWTVAALLVAAGFWLLPAAGQENAGKPDPAATATADASDDGDAGAGADRKDPEASVGAADAGDPAGVIEPGTPPEPEVDGAAKAEPATGKTPDETAKTPSGGKPEQESKQEPKPEPDDKQQPAEGPFSGDPSAIPPAGEVPADGAAAEGDEPRPWYMTIAIAILIAALIAVPFFIGSQLGERLRLPDHGWKIGLALGTIVWAIVIVAFGEIKFGPDLRGGINLIYEIDPSVQAETTAPDGDRPADEGGDRQRTQSIDVDKLIGALSLRVDPGGVREVTIRPHGPRQIEIIIPEADAAELEQIKRQIHTSGSLQFRITANRQDHQDLIQAARENPATEVKEGDTVLARWVKLDLDQFRRVFADRTEQQHLQVISQARATAGDVVKVQDHPVAHWFHVDTSKLDSTFRQTLVTREDPETGVRQVLVLPAGYVLRDNPRGEIEVLVVMDPENVTGEDLNRALAGVDQAGTPAVDFTFKTSGTTAFSRLTSENAPDPGTGFQRRLGIILDNKLISAPNLREPITGGKGQISGNFTEEEVEFLVNILNAGSLPAALNPEPISEQRVGPGLGADTIEQGKNAIIISCVLVAVFMLVYYRFSGLLACLALAANFLLLLAVIIAIKATFTLPGLAGLVLTVGMAVDANVLIFERIREEINRGAALRMAIRNGFGRATTTIVDANLTTLITAIVLYVIGTDQIKGFAVTLILGIIMSMYTAIFCTRIIFDIAEKNRWVKQLTMMRLVSNTSIDFIGFRRYAAVVSILVIAGGIVGVVARGRNILDIDFLGGSSVTLAFHETHEVGEVRGKVEAAARELQEKVEAERQSLADERAALGKDDQQAVKQLEQKYPLADITIPIDISVYGVGNEGREFKVDTSIVDIEVAQRMLEQTFGDELRTNELDYQVLERQASAEGQPGDSISPQGGAAKARPFAPANNAEEPLPDDNVLAYSGEVARLLAQNDGTASDASGPVDAQQPAPETTPGEPPEPPLSAPEEQSKTAPKQKPEKPGQGKTEPQPAAKAAGGEDEPDETTMAASEQEVRLTFAEPMKHDSLVVLVEDAFEQAGGDQVSFVVTHPEYTSGSEIPYTEWTLQIRLPTDQLLAVLEALDAKISAMTVFPSSSKIGARVAGQTQSQAGYALFASLLFIVGYIWFRFQRLMFGLAAVVALLHDVLVTLGVLGLSAILVKYAPLVAVPLMIDPFKISLPIVAAFLTIIGYSLNDTIVVFDRIREVRGKSPDLTAEMINTSINQTLSRTLLTSLTTLIVVLILYFAGGPGIHGFAFSLVVGVMVGTYSSIFVACPALLWMSNAGSPGAKRELNKQAA